MKKQQRISSYISELIAILLILIAVNIAASYTHWRWDLTAEKRFTISPSTKKLLRNLDNTVYIKIYLDGKMPAGFKHLQQSTNDLLDEFQEYAGNKIRYTFINPSAAGDSAQASLYDTLVAKGIKPYNLQVQLKASEGYSQKLIFPGALVDYDGKEISVDLLQGKGGATAFESLNNADALLEYKFANAIYRLQLQQPPLIGYMLGNKELLGPEVNDALRTLSQNYLLDTINLAADNYIPQEFNAVVFVKPDSAFSDAEKLKIDQYVMHGGKILWLIDNLNASMDSLRSKNSFIAFDKGLELQDLLFNYGVRINPDLVEDLQCDEIPLVVGSNGNQPQIQLVRWPYFPLLTPTGNNAIVKNMDPVLSHFASSIDTVKNPDVKKIILLTTSQYSRSVNTPARVSWEEVKMQPDPREFQQAFLPVAVLLEGKFTSLFRNRLDAASMDSINKIFPHPYQSQSVSTTMIVVADGDIITNAISQKEGPLPMGMNAYTHNQYANKQFFLNCLEYLTNTSGIMETRNKNYELRLLDVNKIDQQKIKWQVLNFIVPILFVAIFGFIFITLRKKKYAV